MPIKFSIRDIFSPAREELAHAIVFAIENTFMTGAEVVLDGGWTVQ